MSETSDATDMVLSVVCTDLDLECLATWRDGSESYLYSRLTATTSATAAADGDQYRCLVDSPCLLVHFLPYHTIPYHRFISGNKAHIDNTIKQEDKKTENQ